MSGPCGGDGLGGDPCSRGGLGCGYGLWMLSGVVRKIYVLMSCGLGGQSMTSGDLVVHGGGSRRSVYRHNRHILGWGICGCHNRSHIDVDHCSHCSPCGKVVGCCVLNFSWRPKGGGVCLGNPCANVLIGCSDGTRIWGSFWQRDQLQSRSCSVVHG